MMIRPIDKVAVLMFVVSAALLVGGFFVFNNYIYQEKQADPAEVVVPYTGTLTGEYVCLPHRDTSGPVTLECAFGIKTESGEYYALDFREGNETTFESGEVVTLTGTITPIERLSTDFWQKYNIEGIISF